MQSATTWLLDTGILLHWIRASKAAEAIEAQFHLRESSFRPLICFQPLRDGEHLDAILLDVNTGRRRP